MRKPFRAVPIKLGPRYRRLRRIEQRNAAIRFLGGAALAGAVLGAGSAALSDTGRSTIARAVAKIGVATGVMRARSPQDGDHWVRCDQARDAGTAPIYRDEPGYRAGLDSDGDGIACEPYHRP